MAVSLYCPHCNKHTALSPAPVEYEGDYGQTYTTPALWKKDHGSTWWLGVCNACKMPSLVLNNAQVVYPTPLPEPTDPNVPAPIRADLDEAKLAHSVGCYRASATMSRRVVQLACIEKGAKDGNLVSQIQELRDNGTITEDLKEWATVVRWVGNDGAHPGKDPVTEPDSKDCLDLASQFLHVIFVAPAVAKARRAARGK